MFVTINTCSKFWLLKEEYDRLIYDTQKHISVLYKMKTAYKMKVAYKMEVAYKMKVAYKMTVAYKIRRKR